MTQTNEYDWLEQLRTPADSSPAETRIPDAPPRPSNRATGELWALRSLSGGVGRSTIALNLAFEATKHGKRVCLIDLDTQQPALQLLLNIPNAKTAVPAAVRLVAQQRMDNAALESLLVEVSARHSQVHLLGGGLRALAAHDLEALEVLLHLLLGRYDLVVADTAAGVSTELHRLIGRLAHQQFLVVPADPLGLATLMSPQASDPSLSASSVLFNRVRASVLGSNAQGQLQQVLRDHTSHTVAAFLPLEQEIFDHAQQRGMPIRSVNGRSKALAALTALLGGRDRALTRRRVRG